jgi:hypothetical protein
MPDFLDRLGDELMRAASVPLAEPTTAPIARTPVRRLRGPGRISRQWLLVALALLVAGAGAAIATLGRPSPGPVPPKPGAPLTVNPEPAQLAAFAIVRRPQTAADEIPPEVPVALSGASGANLGLARRAEGGGGGEAWVIPGKGSMCLLSSWPARGAGGAACLPDAPAFTGELAVAAGSARAPGTVFLAGLVPDGADQVTVHLAGGAAVTVAARENVYLAALTGSPESVTFQGPHGPVRVEGLRLPAGAAGG